MFFCHILWWDEFFIQGYYIIGNDYIDNYDEIENDYYLNNNIKFIKSDKNNYNNKALVCFVQNDNQAFCNKFYINYYTGEFYNKVKFQRKCRAEIYAMSLRYFFETKEVAFSCSNTGGSIQAAFFDANLNSPESSYKQFESCENIYGNSVLYSNNKTDYYIVSDVICNGIKKPFVSLIAGTDEIIDQVIERNATIGNVQEEFVQKTEEEEDEIEEEEEEEEGTDIEEEIDEEINEEIEEKIEEEIYEEIGEEIIEEIEE